MISGIHLYTHFVRGQSVSTNLIIGDTMIKHSTMRGTVRVLTFQVWEAHEDGTRTGVWV